jgi:hypothetical protein
MISGNHWCFYTHSGKAFVAITASTPSSYRQIGPITVVNISDKNALISAIVNMITLGNPEIPAVDYRSPENHPSKHPILKLAKMKSWNAFEKAGRCYTLTSLPGEYRIPNMIKMPPRGYSEDYNNCMRFPITTPISEVAERLANKIIAESQAQPPTSQP